jgi:hypothetical protein
LPVAKPCAAPRAPRKRSSAARQARNLAAPTVRHDPSEATVPGRLRAGSGPGPQPRLPACAGPAGWP